MPWRSPGEEDGSTSNPDPDDALTQELPLDLEGDPAAPDGRRRKRKFLLIGAAVILIAGLATGLTLAFTGGSPATGLVITSETVKVTTGTIKQTVATSGTLEPATEADLNFGVSGTVTGVDVQAGQAVTAGQVLATVGTTALSSDVDAAQAESGGRRRPGCPATRRPAAPPRRSTPTRPRSPRPSRR